MNYKDEQGKKATDASVRGWMTTLQNQQRSQCGIHLWSTPDIILKSFACAKLRQYSQVRKFSAPWFGEMFFSVFTFTMNEEILSSDTLRWPKNFVILIFTMVKENFEITYPNSTLTDSLITIRFFVWNRQTDQSLEIVTTFLHCFDLFFWSTGALSNSTNQDYVKSEWKMM